MTAIAADAFVVVDKRLFADKADGFHRAAFNARAAGDATLPDDFGPDGIGIFEIRLQKSLVPWHRVQSKISGRDLGQVGTAPGVEPPAQPAGLHQHQAPGLARVQPGASTRNTAWPRSGHLDG